jgi:hypothetical protein
MLRPDTRPSMTSAGHIRNGRLLSFKYTENPVPGLESGLAVEVFQSGYQEKENIRREIPRPYRYMFLSRSRHQDQQATLSNETLLPPHFPGRAEGLWRSSPSRFEPIDRSMKRI